MSKRSIPLDDKKWDIRGQFVSTEPVYELLSPAELYKARRNKMKEVSNSDVLESPKKSMERLKVAKIDEYPTSALLPDAYQRSVDFHWWDKDPDPYFYWDLK